MYLVDIDLHFYFPFKYFLDGACSSRNLTNTLSSMYTQIMIERPWGEVKRILDKVPKYFCSHATYTNLETHLQRNFCWSDTVLNYIYGFQ